MKKSGYNIKHIAMYKKPSMENIYQSTYYRDVKKDELTRGNKMYNKAQNSMDTGIVSRPAFASQFAQITDQNDSLTGEPMSDHDYFHNNMQPFLSGNVTQNTDIERMSNMTNRNTGRDDLYIHKKETPCFFQPVKDDQVCGMKNNDEFYKSRIDKFRSRNNDFPIQPIRVGPGLNQGYSSQGTGGFHQAATLQYATPVDLQKVKPLTDQTSKTFRVPFQGPSKKISTRGMDENVSKHTPERVFERNKDNWFTTTGAVTKQTERSIQNIVPTNAPITHKEYKGIAKDTQLLQKPNDDYGKETIMVYDNERQTYVTKTVVSNLTSVVNAVVAPLVDTMKNSIKEYLIDAPRQEGNMQPQKPEALTVHDPSDVTRTTIKETTIHDAEKLNLKGQDETYTMLHDDARTTTKETTIHDSEMLNLKGEDGTYYGIDDKARTTTKETVAVKDVYRNIGGTTYRTVSYNPELVAKTTTKQTTIHKSEGFLGGILEGLFGGYLSANPEAKNTNKQFLHESYIGTGETAIKNQTSHEATDNAEIDGTREAIMIAAGHTPNGGQSSLSKIHNGTVNIKSNKTIGESYSQRSVNNPNKIYQSTPNANACGITKETDQLNSYEERLDPKSVLQPLKDNPFNISINPI